MIDEEKVITNYYALRSCRAVAELYSCSQETIRRLLEKNGIQRTGWKNPKREPKYHCPSRIAYSDEEVIDAYSRLKTQDAVREALGISHTTVYRILKRQGIASTGRELNGKYGRKCGGSPRKITDEELLKESLTMTRAEIAEKHNMCICNIDRKLHRLGIHCVTEKEKPGKGIRNKGKYLERLRAAGFGAEYDHTVKLSKLIERHNGICQICGLAVDTSDRTGNAIGRYYPTIDHIIPISKGGSHTWDNVQLAHMICNSMKGVEHA